MLGKCSETWMEWFQETWFYRDESNIESPKLSTKRNYFRRFLATRAGKQQTWTSFTVQTEIFISRPRPLGKSRPLAASWTSLRRDCSRVSVVSNSFSPKTQLLTARQLWTVALDVFTHDVAFGWSSFDYVRRGSDNGDTMMLVSLQLARLCVCSAHLTKALN